MPAAANTQNSQLEEHPAQPVGLEQRAARLPQRGRQAWEQPLRTRRRSSAFWAVEPLPPATEQRTSAGREHGDGDRPLPAGRARRCRRRRPRPARTRRARPPRTRRPRSPAGSRLGRSGGIRAAARRRSSSPAGAGSTPPASRGRARPPGRRSRRAGRSAPRSHHVWRTRRRKEAGERNDNPPIPSAPFCWSVAARANRNAAQRARTSATSRESKRALVRQAAAHGRAAARAAIARWPASVRCRRSASSPR